MDHRLTRRQVVQGVGVAGLGLLAGCRWLPGQAQRRRVPRVGWLTGVAATAGQAEIFRQGLAEYGWIDGENLIVEFRYADGMIERLPALAAELAQLDVDVIVATGEPYVLAARNATERTPIVMATSADPVGTGLVDSLAHPGGNITGLSLLSHELSKKRLELLKETVPAASHVAVVTDPANAVAALEWQETQIAARALGIDLQRLAVPSAGDLPTAVQAAVKGEASALIIFAFAITLANRKQIVGLAAKARLPAMYGRREFVEDGGLLAYGPRLSDMYRRAAYYVDRILRGTKPADLPVEQPMTFDFVVNLNTAQALGITFPNEIMLQVTEVIQ